VGQRHGSERLPRGCAVLTVPWPANRGEHPDPRGDLLGHRRMMGGQHTPGVPEVGPPPITAFRREPRLEYLAPRPTVRIEVIQDETERRRHVKRVEHPPAGAVTVRADAERLTPDGELDPRAVRPHGRL